MRKIVLTFGLIAGGILALMMLITVPFADKIGFDKGMIVGYTSMVLAFLMVFVGVKTYRDNEAGGTVTFGRALTVGLLITLVASVCYVATWEVYYYNFAPDFMDQYAAHVVEKARSSGATEAQLAAQIQQMNQFKEAYKNPLVNIAYTMLEPLPVGILFALVAAWVMSRKRTAKATPTGQPQASLG